LSDRYDIQLVKNNCAISSRGVKIKPRRHCAAEMQQENSIDMMVQSAMQAWAM